MHLTDNTQKNSSSTSKAKEPFKLSHLFTIASSGRCEIRAAYCAVAVAISSCFHSPHTHTHTPVFDSNYAIVQLLLLSNVVFSQMLNGIYFFPVQHVSLVTFVLVRHTCNETKQDCGSGTVDSSNVYWHRTSRCDRPLSQMTLGVFAGFNVCHIWPNWHKVGCSRRTGLCGQWLCQC